MPLCLQEWLLLPILPLPRLLGISMPMNWCLQWQNNFLHQVILHCLVWLLNHSDHMTFQRSSVMRTQSADCQQRIYHGLLNSNISDSSIMTIQSVSESFPSWPLLHMRWCSSENSMYEVAILTWLSLSLSFSRTYLYTVTPNGFSDIALCSKAGHIVITPVFSI